MSLVYSARDDVLHRTVMKDSVMKMKERAELRTSNKIEWDRRPDLLDCKNISYK